MVSSSTFCFLACRFPKFYDAAVLYERFLPLALKHMGPGAVAALVGPAANAVAAIWRAKDLSASGSAAMIAHQRTLLYGRLLREFAAGRSWRARAAFLDFCSHSLQRFSAAFFRVGCRHNAAATWHESRLKALPCMPDGMLQEPL